MISIKLVDAVNNSIANLFKNKVRSFLTMLGIIIGVFAVVSLVSVGIGIQNYVSDQFESLGSNNIFIAPGRVNFTDDPAKSFTANKFEEKHLDLIETYASDFVKAVTPSYRLGKAAVYKSNSFYGTVIGTNEQALVIFNPEIIEGRFISANDVSSKAEIAIIGPQVKEELFPKRNPIGEKIRIDDTSYEIVGYTAEKGQDFDDNIYIPYSTAKAQMNLGNFSGFAAKAKDPDNVSEAIQGIRMALLRDLDADDFSVISQEDVLSSIQSILQILTVAIGAIAGISLIVGGIGIMNIMLVSVTERIGEIGLRKALGATSKNIALQFLIESVLLSVIGGSIGLILGWLASLSVRQFVRTEVPWWAAVLAFGFSMLVGILFGTYPAIQASKKDPIEALRYE